MTAFPPNIQFKYPWRKYQERLLVDLEDHLEDEHLHVIAPPGSGKTILGLQVALRINKPTLVLAPTIAIRNQWIQRFCELFLQVEEVPEWISRDIRKPGFLTVSTYQGLHSACNMKDYVEQESEYEEEVEDADVSKNSNPYLNSIVEGLKACGVKTVVVDEAHHLKNEWWQTLTQVKDKLAPMIVGLTATPPYDVTPTEWQRYLALNGPVDAEISVPELVIEGDLCPHQDYVFFTLPTNDERRVIEQFRDNILKLFEEVKKDETLIRAIESHPAWIDPLNNLDWIYSNMSFYSASLIFLNENGREISKNHLEVIGEEDPKIPTLDTSWLEILLDFYLFKGEESFTSYKEHQGNLENKLRRYGAIEKKQINFSHNKNVTDALSSSLSKLDGVKKIIDFEYAQLGNSLRLVVLSDFIRKEFLVNTSTNTLPLNKFGVIPIFEKIRRENSANIKLGVLTGSIVIIPKSALQTFEKLAEKKGINSFFSAELAFDRNYIEIRLTEQLKHDIVHLVTQIFQDGEIEVLVGTKSLLGEGWDAPAINALVLASFVGSFVLSNQMRGRAIRTQKGNTEKTGNIWHLVCVDASSPTGGDDFELLERRFRGFVGISNDIDPVIENGISRLDIKKDTLVYGGVEQINQETFKYAGNRESLKQKWGLALEKGVVLTEEIKVPFQQEKAYQEAKTLYLKKTISYIVAELLTGLTVFGLQSLQAIGRSMKRVRHLEDLIMALVFLAVVGMLLFARLIYKTVRLLLRYRDISKDIAEIGQALLNSLANANYIHTRLSSLKIVAHMDESGAVHCHLEGGSSHEKSLFINTLEEIINPVDNPRYIIIRKSQLVIFGQRDYHAVPEILGQKKELAEHFKQEWENCVGRCDLVYTRTLEGRKLVLRSRMKSLAAQFEKKLEHVTKWQ